MVAPYIPSVVVCEKCRKIGHKQDICPSAHIKCKSCGRTHEEVLQCQDHTPQFVNCGGPHLGTDSSCPRRIKENKNIREEAKIRKTRQAKTTKPPELFLQAGDMPTRGPSRREPKQADMTVRKPPVGRNSPPKVTELVTLQVMSATKISTLHLLPLPN